MNGRRRESSTLASTLPSVDARMRLRLHRHAGADRGLAPFRVILFRDGAKIGDGWPHVIHPGHLSSTFPRCPGPPATRGGVRMPYATLSTGSDFHPLVWALLTADHSEVAFRVII